MVNKDELKKRAQSLKDEIDEMKDNFISKLDDVKKDFEYFKSIFF